MDIPVIFEDNDLLAIDKPAGIVVNRAESVKEETVQDWIEKKFPQLFSVSGGAQGRKDPFLDFYRRSGIVHRLDRETSGLLLIAKNPQAFCYLQAQFKQREISKKYFTLVHGKMESRQGTIKASIARLPWKREKFGVIVGGRMSETNYQVLTFYRRDKEYYSYLEVSPQTGRTHQIRVHLKYLGHAVISDYLYAGRKTARDDRKFCPRIFLHAFFLKFKQPVSQEILELKSDLPKDLQQVLAELERVETTV